MGEVKYCWLQEANFLKLRLLFFRDSAFVNGFGSNFNFLLKFYNARDETYLFWSLLKNSDLNLQYNFSVNKFNLFMAKKFSCQLAVTILYRRMLGSLVRGTRQA
jgi:hypothetical protein